MFSIIFCPEMAVLLSAPATGIWYGSAISDFFASVTFSTDKMQWLASIPIAVLVVSSTDWRNILAPEHPRNTLLQQWPDYPMVRVIYFAGLAYQVLFSVVASSFFIFDLSPVSPFGFPTLAASVIGSLVGYVTIFGAKVNVQRELDRIDATKVRAGGGA